MYYTAYSNETGQQLAVATSEDGITWSNREQIGVAGRGPYYFEDLDGTPYLYFSTRVPIHAGIRIVRMRGTKVVEPAPDLSGCIKLNGDPLEKGIEVTLKQQGGPNLTTMTNSEGCYEFENADVGKKIKLEVDGF